MGIAYTKKCSKCNYSLYVSDGVGFMFPKVYEETIEKARKGELGQELKRFLEEHVDGAIDASYSIFRCNHCGELANYMNLTMYIPKSMTDKMDNGIWSGAFPFKGANYVVPSLLKDFYIEYGKYHHKCETCGMDMQIVEDDKKLVCPKCKVLLEESELVLWD